MNDRARLAPAAGALLVIAPLIMAVGRALLVPFNGPHWDAMLTQAAAHQGRSDTGWLLAMAASGLLAASGCFLAGLLRADRAKAAVVLAAAIGLGWAGSAGIAAAGMYFSYQGQASDRAAQVKLMTDVNAGHTMFIFLMCVAGAIGYVVLAVSLVRSQVVSKGPAILLGLGGAGSLLTMAGPAKPLLVLAALLLLAGHLLVVRAAGVQLPGTPEPAWEPVAS